VCLEEGTLSGWLHEALEPHIEELVVTGVRMTPDQPNNPQEVRRQVFAHPVNRKVEWGFVNPSASVVLPGLIDTSVMIRAQNPVARMRTINYGYLNDGISELHIQGGVKHILSALYGDSREMRAHSGSLAMTVYRPAKFSKGVAAMREGVFTFFGGFAGGIGQAGKIVKVLDFATRNLYAKVIISDGPLPTSGLTR